MTDIPLAQLASVVLEKMEILDGLDPTPAGARLLGVERLAAASPTRPDSR